MKVAKAYDEYRVLIMNNEISKTLVEKYGVSMHSIKKWIRKGTVSFTSKPLK